MTDHRTFDRDELLSTAASGETVTKADLRYIDWVDLEIPELALKNCLVDETTLDGVQLEALDAADCQFRGSQFRSCSFKEAKFTNCTFVNKAEHTGAMFRFCDFQHAAFEGCDVSFSTFERCDLYDMTILESLFRACDLSSSTFSRQLSKSKHLVTLTLKRSNFSQSNWHGLNLETMTADEVDFTEALMAECNLASAVMTECNLTNAEFLSADFTGANLSASNLQGLDLRSLRSHNGLIILDTQQKQLLQEMGVEVL